MPDANDRIEASAPRTSTPCRPLSGANIIASTRPRISSRASPPSSWARATGHSVTPVRPAPPRYGPDQPGGCLMPPRRCPAQPMPPATGPAAHRRSRASWAAATGQRWRALPANPTPLPLAWESSAPSAPASNRGRRTGPRTPQPKAASLRPPWAASGTRPAGHDQLRRHLADFVQAYNFGRRLKTSFT